MNTQRQTTIKKIIVFSVCSFVTGFLFVPIKDLCSKIDIIEVIHGFAQGYNDLSKMNTPKYGFANWISPKGNLYIGEWENGSLKSGQLITEKGVYEGEFADLSPHGFGIMYYNNGDIYKGNWKCGNKEGLGLKKNHNGEMFFGHWTAGLLDMANNHQFSVEHFAYGIDLSYHQKSYSVKWNELGLFSNKSGDVYASRNTEQRYLQPVSFVFVRSTRAITVDSCYDNHYANAKKHQVLVGTYHFFSIFHDVDKQIDNFIRHSKYEKGDLPPVLDLECEYKNEKKYVKELYKHGIDNMQRDALKWLKAIEEHYHIKPIIYTSERWKKKYLTRPEFDQYDYWIARYYNVRPLREYSWTFWQRTDKSRPNGYNGPIDVNIFNGSFKDFMSYRNSKNVIFD